MTRDEAQRLIEQADRIERKLDVLLAALELQADAGDPFAAAFARFRETARKGVRCRPRGQDWRRNGSAARRRMNGRRARPVAPGTFLWSPGSGDG
jgi:hypothetical protein